MPTESHQLTSLEALSRLDAAERSHFSGLPPYLSLEELGKLLRRSPGTILNDRVRNPAAVPKAVRLPGTRHLLWRTADVMAWLDGLVEGQGDAEPEPKRRRGRPRKAG